MAADIHNTSRSVAPRASKNEANPTPRSICFWALNEIESALIDLAGTLSATVRLAEAEMEDDPSRSTFLTTMERHLTRDLEEANQAFSKAFHELLGHAEGWRPYAPKGDAR